MYRNSTHTKAGSLAFSTRTTRKLCRKKMIARGISFPIYIYILQYTNLFFSQYTTDKKYSFKSPYSCVEKKSFFQGTVTPSRVSTPMHYTLVLFQRVSRTRTLIETRGSSQASRWWCFHLIVTRRPILRPKKLTAY